MSAPQKTPERAPEIGAVVVHYGDPEPTRRCVESLLPQLGPRDRVLVTDNTPSSEATRWQPLDLDPRVRRLGCPDNPGYGAALNRGVTTLARARRSDVWLLLNHDVTLPPGFLDCARHCLSPHDEVARCGAASGPQYLDAEHTRLWFAGGSVIPWLGIVRQSRKPLDAEREREVSFLPGACLLVLDRAWQDVGGFDPRFFLYHEDLDLSLRLRRAGWRLRFVPGLACRHDLGASTASAARSPFYLEQMARTRLMPWPSITHRLWLAVVHTGVVAARSLTILFSERADRAAAVSALWRGHRGALASLLRSASAGPDTGTAASPRNGRRE